MKRFFVIMLGLCLLMGVMLPAAALADDADGSQSSPKDVYIDNTVDNSVSYVTGVIITTDEATGETLTETVYSESAGVTYSNPKTAQVQGMINDAYTAVYSRAEATGYEFQMSTGESTGKVWDNRKYTTVEDDDAVLIGDSDYLQGAYGVDGEYTRTHIASGDYGKETFYRVEAAVTKPAAGPAAYAITASPADGGSVTLSGETAAEGSTVTVTAKADDGWVLETLGVFSVTDHHQISATVYGDSGMTEDSLTFTMPADDVEISATFVKSEHSEPAETPQTEPAVDPAPAAPPAAAPASPAPAAPRSGGRQSPQTGYGNTGALLAAAILCAVTGAGLLWTGRRKTDR